jgi:hypothetical protein
MAMRTWLKTLVTLVVVTATGYLFDRLLHKEGITTRELLLFSDFVVGLVAAALVFILSLHHEQRTRYVAGRLAIIAEMNHHIRNALQVITFQIGSGKDEKEIGTMREAVNRITWALSEVLPQMPGVEDHARRDEAADKAASGM